MEELEVKKALENWILNKSNREEYLFAENCKDETMPDIIKDRIWWIAAAFYGGYKASYEAAKKELSNEIF